jgi:predicted O-linked N-acetylglucosamine transferase (SPINDLY family)
VQANAAKLKTALVMQQHGQLDLAEELCNEILLSQPQHLDALHLMANLSADQGEFLAAIELFDRVLRIKPGSAEVLYNRGCVLRDLGRHEEALESYDRALAIKPDFPEALTNRGNALRDLNRLDDALKSYGRAIKVKPDHVEALYNQGNILRDLNRTNEALESYGRVLKIKPNHIDTLNNRGIALKDVRQLDAAVASYRRALEIKPDYAAAHHNLGNVLIDLGQLDAALASYRRALEIKPDFAKARNSLLFSTAYCGALSPPDYLSEARLWEANSLPTLASASAHRRTFIRPPRTNRRLRVGYVSGDFRQHAVSYFIAPLFEFRDRNRIELFAYPTAVRRDKITEKLEAQADHWHSLVGLSDEAARQHIEADQIDVLIDLSGHSIHNRLGVFALRAAPVQAHYLGYFASTGLTAMDYWIGDTVLLPRSEDIHYSETIWRLPRVWVSYRWSNDAPASKWHPREDGTIWLGSFNNLAKITPATLALWAKTLHALPEGRLLLKTPGLVDPGSRKCIEVALAAYGISAERLELLGITDAWTSHMALYDRLDVALDPVGGVGGGTTTCDTLWMGVPVITFAGQSMAQRMTASMLDAIGQPEWIAESEDDYVNKVVELARDVELRRSLRFRQREKMRNSPLCDAPGLARSLEDAYEAMFDAWYQTC